jgi:formate/nitrite transporter FocA (FNT family)
LEGSIAGYQHAMADQVETAFERSIEEGQRRINRTWASLLATGAVGALDVGFGVLAMLLVLEATGNELLAALAFSIGFIALTLASSELFTENFLVPVTAVVAGKSRVRGLVRLWAGTAASNIVAGWAFMGIVMLGFPELRGAARDVGSHYAHLGITVQAFAAGIVGGATITLMTWMERGTESTTGKLTGAVAAGFLLAGAKMNHAIVMSLAMFAALHAGGAHFGYADWLGAASWAALANLVGGMGLVTVLRLVQVGPQRVEAERHRGGPPILGDDEGDDDHEQDPGGAPPRLVVAKGTAGAGPVPAG